MKFLNLGSIVHLKDDKRNIKLMIISYLPRVNENGKEGYYDYAGCLYPFGLVEDKAFFFNEEDIDEVLEGGYSDEDGKRFIQSLNDNYDNIKPLKFRHIDKSYGKDDEDLSDLLED